VTSAARLTEKVEASLRDLRTDCVGTVARAVIKALGEAWKNVGRPESSDYWTGKLEYDYDTRKALLNI
jgi:hypothetical protein